MKVKKKNPPEMPKRRKKTLLIGIIGLSFVIGGMGVLFTIDQNQEPIYTEWEVLSDDPNNYLAKRVNLQDGSTHWTFNKTETVGSKLVMP